MAAPQYLQIINPSCGGDADVSFGQFPMLPKELRMRIWECAVEKYRLLEVEVKPTSDSEDLDSPLYWTRNTLNRLISGRNYTAIVQGYQLQSKLLCVNRESRQSALRFYRVHIPCHHKFHEKSKKVTKIIFYFNPEYDFMHLSTDWPVEHTYIDFLHDLRAYDPKNVGLLNLALDNNTMTGLHSLASIDYAPARATFVDTLSRLQQIIWVTHSASGRAIMGPLQTFDGVGFRFNHSMPVKAITPSFNLLSHDPRLIEPELRYVLTANSDPRQMYLKWRELLMKWEIRQAQPPRERVLFAYNPLPYEGQIYNVETANRFLKKEEETWLGSQQRWDFMVIKQAGKVPIEGPEELVKAVRPAIGFWLFPAEALGGLEGDLLGMKKVFDMTGHRPELALSCLL